MNTQPDFTNLANQGGERILARPVAEGDVEAFDALLDQRHYLGACRASGDFLRQAVYVDGKLAALLAWGPACYALKDRDLWIGWSAQQRVERLKLVVQNRRFLVLSDKGAAPNLASMAMGAALRSLPASWSGRFGYRPLLAESFTDPELYAGTCYKASNWEPAGFSAGYSRHRADFYIPNDRPKRLWLRPLDPQAKAILRSSALPGGFEAAACAAPSGTLPLKAAQVGSLRDALAEVPDPRRSNARFRIGAVLTIASMALMAGRRDIAEIHRYASKLTQPQRRGLMLPLKKGTGAFLQVPGYSVFREVLMRVDPEAFAAALSRWLQAKAGELPAALALDGKMVRDHVGLVTLADHDDGAPHAAAVYDQKEGTERCELKAAQELLARCGLDGRTVTADALHCQKETARIVAEKGGEYLLQIKGNQPGLLARAEALDRAAPPFSSEPAPPAAEWSCAGSAPTTSSPTPRACPTPARS